MGVCLEYSPNYQEVGSVRYRLNCTIDSVHRASEQHVFSGEPASLCDTDALFSGALTLLRNVCPSPLPAEWWVSTCAEVDVTSVRLGLLMQFFGSNAKLLDQATLESASWLGPALAEAVHICKVNASAGLSARPTMSFMAVSYALQLVDVAAQPASADGGARAARLAALAVPIDGL